MKYKEVYKGHSEDLIHPFVKIIPDIIYFKRSGEFRSPLKGEYYLSGAEPEVYTAPNN